MTAIYGYVALELGLALWIVIYMARGMAEK